MYEFFIHSPRHMIFNNQIVFCSIKSELKPFQPLEIFSILQIEVDTQSGSILTNEMEYGKVRYLVFKKCVANAIKPFNV